MLQACAKCHRLYPEGESPHCPADGTPLQSAEQVPLQSNPGDAFLGTTIGSGRYQLRRVIADGGMGRVYEVRDCKEDRRVAIKILHHEVAQDNVNIERFKREAETSRSLRHSHIIEVFDFAEEPPSNGRTEASWYLVMEYLEGEELRVVLDRQKTLSPARAVRIMAQTALALDTAHQQGYVHRDLKPDNLFLVRTSKGENVKLLDFGSVKFTKGQDKGQKLTVMGTTIGSPYYMSPEQAKGANDLDHRADVWALGAIIYEMVVGKVPFQAKNGPQILFKILSEEPLPPSMANPEAADALDDFIVKALAKKREDRFQTCGELADALGHALGLSGTHTEWATTPETELTERMKNPAPVQPNPAPMKPAPMKPAPMNVAPTQTKQTPPNTPNSDNTVADDYNPVKPVSVGVYVGIGVVVLVLLAGIAMAMRG